MPKGLKIATNYYNRIAAIKDFKALADFAVEHGFQDLVEKYRPAENAGWRKIDKQLGKLRAKLKEKGFEAPPNPSLGQGV